MPPPCLLYNVGMETNTALITVHNHSEVELIDMMGDDYRILQAARVSTGATPSKGDKKDRGLIRYLYRNRHTSPFEMVVAVFRIKMPIFVARQLVRHRTASLNEKSGRYSEMTNEFFLPEQSAVGPQSTTNHQGRDEGELSGMSREEAVENISQVNENTYAYYQALLNAGVAKEMARTVLPLTTYTEIYWQCDLHNLLHFFDLRLDPHAQQEIREIAEAMYTLLKNTQRVPWALEIHSEVVQAQKAMRAILAFSKSDGLGVDLLQTLANYIHATAEAEGAGEREVMRSLISELTTRTDELADGGEGENVT